MNIPYGEEDADARAWAAAVFFFSDDDNAAVSGGNDGVRISGDGTVWVAKERETEKCESNENARGDPPVESESDAAEKEGRQTEVVAFLDHE